MLLGDSDGLWWYLGLNIEPFDEPLLLLLFKWYPIGLNEATAAAAWCELASDAPNGGIMNTLLLFWFGLYLLALTIALVGVLVIGDGTCGVYAIGDS